MRRIERGSVRAEAIDFNPFGTVGVGERREVYDSLARIGPIHRVTLPPEPQRGR